MVCEGKVRGAVITSTQFRRLTQPIGMDKTIRRRNAEVEKMYQHSFEAGRAYRCIGLTTLTLALFGHTINVTDELHNMRLDPNIIEPCHFCGG